MKGNDYCEIKNKLYKYYRTQKITKHFTNEEVTFKVVFFNEGGSYILSFCWHVEDNRISISSTLDYSVILNLLYVKGLIPSEGEVAPIKFKDSKDFITYCQLICNCIEEYMTQID